jgi:hypothetical protein
MAGSRTLKLSILADIDNLKKNLNDGDKEIQGFGGKLEKFGKVAAAAFAAAAAAAAAYAVKLAVDGVKAAIEDEAAQLRLANALKNVTGATNQQIAAIEQQILQMSLAFGVADDQLRPAFQRLAIATGDLGQAQKGLQLALDISAATGKNLEAVSNALGKAYEGNTSALGRLGIGLSAAEIKTLGLDGTMKQLAATFGGAATVQANTLEGQMARLKILFQETQESVGQGLLPAVKGFMDYLTNVFIPMMIQAKNRAIEPIKRAFAENREELEALWKFTKQYLVPVFEVILVSAIERVGQAIGGIMNIIGAVMRGIEGLVNGVIGAINAIIRAYNAIPELPNVNTIGKVDFTANSDNRVGGVQLPFGGKSVVSQSSESKVSSNFLATSKSVTSGNVISSTTSAKSKGTTEEPVKVVPVMPQLGVAANTGRFVGPGLMVNPEAEPTVNIIVQAPSVIDQNGFTAAVVDAFNQVQARTGGGASRLVSL